MIYGCKITRGAPSISHLLFADNCYFFFRATRTNARIMKYILMIYEMLSGQVINYDKSDFLLVQVCLSKKGCTFVSCWGLEKQQKMYMAVRKNKLEVFDFLSNPLQYKIQGWCNKELSRQGKLILLKTTVQAIPNFWMGLF